VMGSGDYQVLEPVLELLGAHPNVRCLPMRTIAAHARNALAA
jgi:hypothetical protein